MTIIMDNLVACGYVFTLGKKYLAYAYNSRTKAADAGKDMKALGEF